MRGMMKWQPFKSLTGQYKVLEEHKREREKVQKPELSDDEIEDINNLLVSLSKGDSVDVTYFDDGSILHFIDSFVRCDTIERKVMLRRKNIGFDVLLNLKRVE